MKILLAVQYHHEYYQERRVSRLNVAELSKQFKVNRNTIGLFLKNIYIFIEKEDTDAPDNFVYGLKDESKRIYEELYYLLFYKSYLRLYEPRTENAIMHKLVTNEYPEDD